MGGMPQAMISVVCPRGCVAMDVQPVAITTVAPVSAPARTGQMALRSCIPSSFQLMFSFMMIPLGLVCCWLIL